MKLIFVYIDLRRNGLSWHCKDARLRKYQISETFLNGERHRSSTMGSKNQKGAEGSGVRS